MCDYFFDMVGTSVESNFSNSARRGFKSFTSSVSAGLALYARDFRRFFSRRRRRLVSRCATVRLYILHKIEWI